MSEPPRLRSAEYSVSMKRGSETSELNAVGCVNVCTRKERGGGRKARKADLYTETPRALKARARPTAAGRNVAGVKLNGTSHRCVT